ncbi:5-dehydro-4-deoxy-D-glucuronate isomerase [Oceanivirga salmonicida]|uniref:5-dehydro-4-deoxy-D-glucuronate isomerase n=1 Tax=Oceanivirga salmonicida TaxID=1769291 RepID=UPI0012E0F356|nr:5-dehydro-4-deoxy-D-glucuronate isomerase [Oceanivirga salmonicida]
MNLDMRYSTHPQDVKKYDTEKLRENFLIEEIFKDDEIKFTYSFNDRMIIGGIKPVNKEIILQESKELGTEYFLERREMGVINVGGTGKIVIDGTEYELKNRDGLYIGMGNKELKFSSLNKENVAKFYIVSATAHTSYPIVKVDIEKANPLKMGELTSSNKRTIYKYIDPSVCKSCQLLMGMTILEEGSIWNTMPAHIHKRRMETYFYFDMEDSTRLFHFMGEPTETRHLLVKNEQGVISPSWSIHAGAGTGKYTFIWTMGGENQNYSDLNVIPMEDLK